MNATFGKKTQELPPKGGYGPIQTDRIKLRNIIGVRGALGILLTTTVAGVYGYYLTHLHIRRTEIEMRSSRLAIWPLLVAEHDRAILKQMRRNRDEEAELMKNVEGWEVGTYFGEPMFYLNGEDQFREPLFIEHFAHSNPEKYMERVVRHLWT